MVIFFGLVYVRCRYSDCIAELHVEIIYLAQIASLYATLNSLSKLQPMPFMLSSMAIAKREAQYLLQLLSGYSP